MESTYSPSSKIKMILVGFILLLCVVSVGVFGDVLNVFGAGLTSTDIQLSSPDTGASVTVNALFTTVSGIPANGKIKITFPGGFNVAGANSGTCANMDGTFATSVSGQIVTITRQNDGTPRGAVGENCSIQGIKNPAITGSAGTYTIQTTDAANTLLDADAAVAGDTILASVMTGVDVQPASLVSGTTNVVTVTFTTKNGLENNGKIKVTFPGGFNVSGASGGTCSSMDGSFATSVAGQEVTLTRSGGTFANPGAQTCTINSIVNPGSVGSTGTYSMQTTTNSNQLHDVASNIPADTITAPPATLTSTNVQPATLNTGDVGTATISFTTTSNIPANGKIQIVFPGGFNVSGASGGTCSSMDGSFATSVAGQTVTITRQNDGTIQTTGAETCTVNNIVNPSINGVPGTYSITTLDNANATINTDVGVTGDNIFAAILANTNVQPASLVQGTTNVVTVTFTTKNVLENNGKINVIFPGGFNVSGATGGTCSSMDGSFATSVNSQTVTITRSGGAAATPGPHTCTINSIVNPASTGTTGAYTIQTATNANQLHDVDGSVAADTITGASSALTLTNVQPASFIAGAMGSVTVTFTTTTTIPANGKIKITFPVGFNVSSASGGACASMDGSFATNVSGQTVVLVRQNNGTGQTSAAETCTFNNVVNPNIVGLTGTYVIQTTDTANTLLDADSSVAADAIMAANLASTNVEPATRVAGAMGTATISFTTINPLESDGKVKVIFPGGFNVSGANSGTCSSMDGSFATSVSGQTVIITRSGGTLAMPGPQTCTIANIGNPAISGVTGPYAIQTTVASNAIHDQDGAIPGDALSPAMLGGVNVQPSSFVAGAVVPVTVTFTSVNAIANTDVIAITFPLRFNVSGANSGTCSSMDGSFVTSVSGQVVSLTRDGTGSAASGGMYTCVIQGIRNPPIAGSTGVYAVETAPPGGGGVARDKDATVSADTIAAAPLTNANVEPVIKRIGIAATVNVSFNTANDLESDGKINITFPVGFDVANATSGLCTTMDGAFATSVSGQTVTLTRSGGSVATAGAQSCTVSGIINPRTAGLGGLYTVTTTDASNALHDVNTTVAGDTFSASSSTDTASSGSASNNYKILVTGPAAGEAFQAGDRVPLTWSTAESTLSPSYINLWYATDGGTFWTRIMSNTANDGEYIWTAPDINSSKVVVKAEASDLVSVLASAKSEVFTLGLGDIVTPETSEESPVDTTSPTEDAPQDTTTQENNLAVGSLVRTSASSDVFYIEEGMVKRRFPDVQTFFTYADSFADVQVVAEEVLQRYTQGDDMPPKEKTVLVKVPTNEKVYALEGVGAFLRLRWVASEAVARAVYGPDWADYVIDILSSVFEKIAKGDDITSVDTAPSQGDVPLHTRDELNGH